MAAGSGGDLDGDRGSPHFWPEDPRGSKEDLFAENQRLRWVVGDGSSSRAQAELEDAADEGAATLGGNGDVEERRNVRQRRE